MLSLRKAFSALTMQRNRNAGAVSNAGTNEEDSELEHPLLGQVVAEKYKIISIIGRGAFGDVFVAQNRSTKKLFAIKAEKFPRKTYQLKVEYNVLRRLRHSCFPKVKDYVTFQKYHLMIMNLLGPNLEELKNYCGNKFSIKTVLLLFFQMLDRIECLHNHNLVHRDIKPQNFVMGMNEAGNTLHLVDFGFVKRIRKNTHESAKARRFIGTPLFASVRAHLLSEQGRIDDIESCIYIAIYLLKNSLPWQSIPTSGISAKEWYAKIAEMKISMSPEEICCEEAVDFVDLLYYVRSIESHEVPDYAHLKKTIARIFADKKLCYDKNFDWILIRHGKRNPE